MDKARRERITGMRMTGWLWQSEFLRNLFVNWYECTGSASFVQTVLWLERIQFGRNLNEMFSNCLDHYPELAGWFDTFSPRRNLSCVYPWTRSRSRKFAGQHDRQQLFRGAHPRGENCPRSDGFPVIPARSISEDKNTS